MITVHRAQKAHQRAEQIRLGFQQTAVLYARAVAEEDWAVLGYRSVTAWAAGEFGPDRFSAERRKEIVAMLTAAGHTQRVIAAATNSSKGSVGRDQQEIAASSAPDGAQDDGQPPVQSARQAASRNREAAKRSRPPPSPGSKQRHLGGAEIEVIIAEDLTRGQIKKRFGVGEHAAQLARTTAVATLRERQRARTRLPPRPAPPPPTLSDVLGQLREQAEEYLTARDQAGLASRIGTDRSKLTLFLDWLASQHDPGHP